MKFFVFSVLLLALIAVQTADARGRFGTRVATDGSDETDDGKDGKDETCDPSEVCREFRETGKFPGCPEAKTCAARYSDPCRPILCDGAGTFVCTDLVVKPSELNKKSSFKRASSRRNRRNHRG